MSQYISLRQLHPIACQVKEKWGEDNAVLAIMVVSPGDKDYYAEPGDHLSQTPYYDDLDYPTLYDGTIAIDAYALSAKRYGGLPDYVAYPGDKVLVITGHEILPLGYTDYHVYCTALIRDARVLDIIELPVKQSTTQEA
jgi:hypothetical protein